MAYRHSSWLPSLTGGPDNRPPYPNLERYKTMNDQDIKQTIALANPEMQLYMLASWTDMSPEEVLAVARVHATFALKQAEAILKTAGYSEEDTQGYVTWLRDNPNPLLDLECYKA